MRAGLRASGSSVRRRRWRRRRRDRPAGRGRHGHVGPLILVRLLRQRPGSEGDPHAPGLHQRQADPNPRRILRRRHALVPERHLQHRNGGRHGPAPGRAPPRAGNALLRRSQHLRPQRPAAPARRGLPHRRRDRNPRRCSTASRPAAAGSPGPKTRRPASPARPPWS